MDKKSVLFDLDGVIIDSKYNMIITWNCVCSKHPLNINFEEYFAHIGQLFSDILSILGIIKYCVYCSQFLTLFQTPNKKLQGKPVPDHLLYAMTLQNKDLSNTLYLDDTMINYQLAQEAGIDYAHSLWGYG